MYEDIGRMFFCGSKMDHHCLLNAPLKWWCIYKSDSDCDFHELNNTKKVNCLKTVNLLLLL